MPLGAAVTRHGGIVGGRKDAALEACPLDLGVCRQGRQTTDVRRSGVQADTGDERADTGCGLSGERRCGEEDTLLALAGGEFVFIGNVCQHGVDYIYNMLSLVWVCLCRLELALI